MNKFNLMLSVVSPPKIVKNTFNNISQAYSIEYIRSIVFINSRNQILKNITGPFSLNSWEEIEELFLLNYWVNKNNFRIIFTFGCSYQSNDFENDFEIVFHKNPDYKISGIMWNITYNTMQVEPRNLYQVIKVLFPNIKKNIQTPKPSLIKLIGLKIS
jgi:hypothetical protein